jgi:hypothetical protein
MPEIYVYIAMCLAPIIQKRKTWKPAYSNIILSKLRVSPQLPQSSISYKTLLHLLVQSETVCYKSFNYSWFTALRTSPRHVGATRNANNLAPPSKSIFCTLFQPRTGLVNIFEAAYSQCESFLKKLFCMWKPEFNSTIFLTIPVMS